MRILFGLIYLTFLFVPNSCKTQEKAIATDQLQNDSQIELVDSDDYSGIVEPENLVIRDTKSLTKFYAKINRTRKPGLPIPTIDFAKHTVLIVCAGEQKPNTKMVLGYGNEDESELQIHLTKQKNVTSGDVGITVVTYPFYIYQIPFTEKTVKFEYTQ